jgi:hypothetical protein
MRPSSSQVELEIVVDGKTRVLRVPAPKGFPRRLIPILADFMRLGFEYCRARLEFKVAPSYVPFAPSLRGRHSKTELDGLGRKIDVLRKEGRSYGDISRRICPKKQQSKHHCEKGCNDRIRQVHRYWLRQQNQLQVEKELTSFE